MRRILRFRQGRRVTLKRSVLKVRKQDGARITKPKTEKTTFGYAELLGCYASYAVRFSNTQQAAWKKGKHMVGIVKWLRHMVVVHACVGSNPTTHPILNNAVG